MLALAMRSLPRMGDRPLQLTARLQLQAAALACCPISSAAVALDLAAFMHTARPPQAQAQAQALLPLLARRRRQERLAASPLPAGQQLGQRSLNTLPVALLRRLLPPRALRSRLAQPTRHHLAGMMEDPLPQLDLRVRVRRTPGITRHGALVPQKHGDSAGVLGSSIMALVRGGKAIPKW